MPRLKELVSKVHNTTSHVVGLPSTGNSTLAVMLMPGNVEHVAWPNKWTKINKPVGNPRALVRYGCVMKSGPVKHVLNKASAIRLASNKPEARKTLADAGVSVPPNTPGKFPKVVRRNTHMKGKYFYVANNEEELREHETKHNGQTYTSDLIDAIAEFRFHVSRWGHLLVGQKKIKEEGRPTVNSEHVWNHDNGYVFKLLTFKNLERYGSIAVEAVKALGLDFGAVDVKMDGQGNLYVLEVNTAPAGAGIVKRVYAAFWSSWERNGYQFDELDTPEVFMRDERLQGALREESV